MSIVSTRDGLLPVWDAASPEKGAKV
jgi:hypothetical protein